MGSIIIENLENYKIEKIAKICERFGFLYKTDLDLKKLYLDSEICDLIKQALLAIDKNFIDCRGRKLHHVRLRQIGIYLTYKYTNMGLIPITQNYRYTGTSCQALHCIRKINKLKYTDSDVQAKLQKIENVLSKLGISEEKRTMKSEELPNIIKFR